MKKIIESYKRKLAGEEGWVLKRGAQLRIALCYPNVYSIGMANLGFQAMYEIFNNIPEVSCERGFLPDDASSARSGKGSGYDQALPNRPTPAGMPVWAPRGSVSDHRPVDAMSESERTRTPLLSLESPTKLRDFDVIAFSISFETDYVNLARMLQMSGVPVWSKDRTRHDPLIVMGGAASFLNPEPIAEFTDIIGVGEGEILGPKLIDVLLENESKEDTLLQLARQGRGFYVPSLYHVSYKDDGTVEAYTATEEGVPARVGRAVSAESPKEGSLRRAIRRGKTDKIGLVSTAVCDHPEISEILQGLRAMDYRISVSSLRLDQISEELLDALVESRDQQIAVAPETGSDRLRRVINKNLTNDEIVDICGAVFDRGMLTIKLYMMVGLPTETDEDLDEMIVLVDRIKDRMLEAGKRFGRAGKIIPSLNGFVPKPNTPFQWEPICEEKELKRRLKRVSKKLARIPNVEVRAMSARIAHEQALFSSGDRRIARVIEATARLNGDLNAAIRETQIDPYFHTSRRRAYDEILPWDIVDSGISREFMQQEDERAHEARSTAPCPSVNQCTRCGVCPTTWLGEAPAALVQLKAFVTAPASQALVY